MFGIFYMFYNTLFGTAAKISTKYNNVKNKQEAEKRGYIIYHDHDNQLRLVSNDKQVYITTKNNHKVITDLYNGKVYKDITEENERRKIKNAQLNNETVIVDYKIWKNVNNYNDKHWYKCHILPCYKDIQTGNLYIDVRINGINFYMDVESGYIVRPKDNEDISKIKNNISVQTIIKVFNERQNLIKNSEDFHKFWWADSHFYLRNYYIEITKDNKIIERYR